MRNMTARAEALTKGEKQYVTGVPCKKGHLSPRSTKTGTCVECTKLAAQAWLASRPEKSAQYTAAYRERNQEQVREKDRLLHAKLRQEKPDAYRQYRLEHYRKKVAAQGREVRTLNRLPVTELVSRLQEVHAGKLQYVSGYASMNDNAVFLCTIHNKETLAHPHNVLRGAIPCGLCNHMRSEAENQLAEFLSKFTDVQQRNRSLIRPREIDVYMPEQKLAVEYCGEYWHSHGDSETERKNKNRHYEKFTACKALGIRLLTVYESEWRDRAYALKRLLRNAVGKSKGRLMARKCDLRHTELSEARSFYERYHPQGGDGSGEHYGLYWNNKLVACMRFTFGANDRGENKSRVWTLTRYATRITVAGAASRLFKAFVDEHRPTEVKSFSDNRYFEGGMYTQLGFSLEEETGPDYQVWSPKLGLRPKSHYQRRNLPKRLQEHGIPEEFHPETDRRSEAEMTFFIGCRRLYDCGKKRWVWQA
jgi:G:T-mismatch repair DNA endonuclease (very short patch repair protein)